MKKPRIDYKLTYFLKVNGRVNNKIEQFNLNYYGKLSIFQNILAIFPAVLMMNNQFLY